ncbi:uncharacterized protein LOC135118965 [Helicoverpa armigera]|uniref:uncharacterized protein LOC135118965 n=1 Tax=Helicoverpa armigera TaxID=29058 RepID=UPI0030826C45
MSTSEASPFGRSQLLQRSPPPTPTQPPPPSASNPPAPTENEQPTKVISTSEIQSWLVSIDTILNEVCTIVEGKMNSEQKLRVSTLCRKVQNGTSQMAVLYQSLKAKTIQAHTTIQHLQDQQNVGNSLQQFRELVEAKLNPPENTSYAGMVKKGSDIVRPANLKSVAIYPSDKTQTSDDTKSLVQKIISPEQLKLQVRGIKKVKNGGVLISTENIGDIEKLKSSDKIVSSGLKIEEPSKRRPRIAVIGVPVALTEKEVFECIYEQNLSAKLPNLTRESFLECIKLSHKSGKRDLSTCNYILELPASIRKVIIDQSRIFINWTSCPVRDFTIVTRCFNCQQFGHAAKFCRETNPTCSHCGDSGHSSKECSNKPSTPLCASCKRFKRKCDHPTGDVSCPARKHAEMNYINSIDYEGA